MKKYYRFKTQKEIREQAKKTGWFEDIYEIAFVFSRAPYIYTTKIFEIVKEEKYSCEIRNVVSGHKHKVYKFTLKEIGR